MKVDFHVHTKERSICAKVDEEYQIRGAIAAGLDGIAFTDHNKLLSKDHLAFLNQKYAPFKIFTGIEVVANQEDWLVIGVHDTRLEKATWNYADLWKLVRSLGGYLILAHPFRYASIIHVDLAAYPPDGIEIASYNTPVDMHNKILQQAKQFNLKPLTNSDAHYPNQIGTYANLLPTFAENDEQLLKVLNNGFHSEPNRFTPLSSLPSK